MRRYLGSEVRECCRADGLQGTRKIPGTFAPQYFSTPALPHPSTPTPCPVRRCGVEDSKVAAAVTPWSEVESCYLRDLPSARLQALTRAATSQASKVAAPVTAWRKAESCDSHDLHPARLHALALAATSPRLFAIFVALFSAAPITAHATVSSSAVAPTLSAAATACPISSAPRTTSPRSAAGGSPSSTPPSRTDDVGTCRAFQLS